MTADDRQRAVGGLAGEPDGRPRVVILGAGFGGLWVARELAGEPVEVTIVDRNNFHTFYPLLYQVGAAALGADETVYPVRRIFRGDPVRVGPEAVELSDGESFAAETTVWTAGVRGDGPSDAPGLPFTEEGWIRVDGDLRVEGWPRVYALGDVALVAGERLPLVAPAATQGGTSVARNILRDVAGEPPEPFEYHDKGILGTIGRNAAYARIFGRSITGFVAWVIWLVIHIQRLIGFRNRLIVLLNWIWDYFLFDRPVRLISPRGPRGVRGDEKIRGQGEGVISRSPYSSTRSTSSSSRERPSRRAGPTR